MKKTASGIMLTLLLTGLLLMLAFNIQHVKASGTVYIRADGSIDPPTAPISTVDNVTYTFTDNINDSIVVERNNIVVDGAGYSLKFGVRGLNLTERNNVTVKNINIKACSIYGIYLSKSNNCNIVRNNITKNHWGGIQLNDSSNNTVTGNNVIDNFRGIGLDYSSDNTLSGNYITASGEGSGIDIYCSSNNTICGNNVTKNHGWGIVLSHSLNNNLSENSITNNAYGMHLKDSSNTSLFGNNINANNKDGIQLESSSNNNITGNMFSYDGLFVWSSYGNVVADNLVNGKPLVYLEDISDFEVEDAGQVILVSCTNITIENLNLYNTDIGIQLWETKNSTIAGNNITANLHGIYLLYSPSNSISGNNVKANEIVGIYIRYSSNNCIIGNNVTANNRFGIYLSSSSNNNIYHNNFVNNTYHALTLNFPDNVWDLGYPSGGNYWSDYSGVDIKSGAGQDLPGSDGIGDTPYIIDANNVDHYPLMNPYGAPPPPTYTLTITATVGGTTDPTPGTYSYTANSSVQVTAVADEGYLFEYWELDDVNVGSANPYTVLMDEAHTLKAVSSLIPPPLSASINPLSASINVGESLTFTSTVTGGYTPYSYQWYLNGNPVSGATSASWTFTHTTSGIYYVYLKVTDDTGNTTQSETARITVTTVPVGGYSVPIQLPTTAKPATLHIALLTILTILLTKLKRKTKRKH